MLNPKRRTEIKKHPEKHRSIARLIPSAFDTQPEINPPVSPPAPSNIMAIPLRCNPEVRLCIQDGIHENIPHRPMSIDPKMIEPVIRFGMAVSSKVFLIR